MKEALVNGPNRFRFRAELFRFTTDLYEYKHLVEAVYNTIIHTDNKFRKTVLFESFAYFCDATLWCLSNSMN